MINSEMQSIVSSGAVLISLIQVFICRAGSKEARVEFGSTIVIVTAERKGSANK
jgi:hypothetical protein